MPEFIVKLTGLGRVITFVRVKDAANSRDAKEQARKRARSDMAWEYDNEVAGVKASSAQEVLGDKKGKKR